MSHAPIRLVALDVDGTVLRSDGTLSAATIAAVRAAQEAGAVVTLATSRRWGGVHDVALALGLTTPLILYDGALILEFPARRLVARAPLDPAVCQDMAADLAAVGITPIVQYGGARDEWLVTTLDAAADLSAHPFLRDYPRQVRARPLATLTADRARPLRLTAFALADALTPGLQRLAPYQQHVHLLPLGSFGTAEITVTRSGVTKGAGLVRLARQLGIPLAQTLAVGDSANDLPLFRAAGLSVAMGQAPPDVRAAARFITGDNDDDGVAEALDRFVIAPAKQRHRDDQSDMPRGAF